MADLDKTDASKSADSYETSQPDQGIFSSCNWSNKLITKFSQRLKAVETLVAQIFETLPSIQEAIMSKLDDALAQLLAADATLDTEVQAIATAQTGVSTVIANQAATIGTQAALIQQLQDQLANDEPVTAEQLDSLSATIGDIGSQNASLDAAAKALQAALPTSTKKAPKPAVRPTHLG